MHCWRAWLHGCITVRPPQTRLMSTIELCLQLLKIPSTPCLAMQETHVAFNVSYSNSYFICMEHTEGGPNLDRGDRKSLTPAKYRQRG